MERFKYPRTFHLPFSKTLSSDDKFLKDFALLEDNEVVATIKMDGENTTGYPDGYSHARSIDSKGHPSRDWFKEFWATKSYNLPENFRICGENLFAKHSIHYQNLKSYFYGFSVWENDQCLNWDDTLEWFELLGIEPVKELYRGKFDMGMLESLVDQLDPNVDEGFVVRLASNIRYHEFSKSFCKYVRSNHVTTDQHWMHKQVEKNGIITDNF